MISEKQLASNRENALRSTGPQTPEGKEVSKRNALKYGVYSNDLILRHGLIRENPADFENLFGSLKEDLRPEGAMETIVVEKIAVSLWRLRRIYRAELAQFKTQIDGLKEGFGHPVAPDVAWLDPDEPYSPEEAERDAFRVLALEKMGAEELAQQQEFRELLQEKYPDATIQDLSVHQRKRLIGRFRRELCEQTLDRTKVLLYQRQVTPEQMSLLVPNERLGSELTRLERSIERDLRMLFDLQERRAVKDSGFLSEK